MSFDPGQRSITDRRLGEGYDIDLGLRQHMLRVYNLMAGGLAVTGATAFVAVYSGFYAAIAHTPLMWLILLAPVGLALFFGFRLQQMSLATAQALFWSYAVLMGLSLAGIFLVYTGTSIARVFFITAATFLAMSLWGYTTRSDLTRMGSFLMMGLIGIVIAGVVNLFLGSAGLQFAISVIAVVVFTGLTAWDTQRIKATYAEMAGGEMGGGEMGAGEMAGAEMAGKAAILGALMLYLDFINLFVALLQLMGERRER